MRKIQEHEYLWMIRLSAGPLVFLPGREVSDALSENHLTTDEVRRYMPVKFQAAPVKTEAKEKALKLSRQEKLIKARAVKKARRVEIEKNTTDTLS